MQPSRFSLVVLAVLVVSGFVACRADDVPPSTRDSGTNDMTVTPPPPRDGGECTRAETENTAALCSDGCSNDDDPFVDCDDFDCEGLGACGGRDSGPVMMCPGPETPEETVETCSDGCSNDGDRFVDCDDFDCTGIGPCPGRDGGSTPICPTRGDENTPAACSDGCSNDGDRFVDCDDFDCTGIGPCPGRDGGPSMTCPGPMMPEDNDAACSDGCSNDGDRFVDCDDFDCEGLGGCPGTPPRDAGPAAMVCPTAGPENTEAACSDGCSNDCDRFADCDDFDCAGLAGCPPRTTDGGAPAPVMLCAACGAEDNVAACADGCSNDGDRFVDCDDFDCAGIGTCPARM